MTDRERTQRALLDRVADERGRIRAGRFRRSVRLVALSLVAASSLAAVAWIMSSAVMSGHPFWTGVALGAVLMAGHGLAAEVLGWLRAHDTDVLLLRTVGREHRDFELDGWQETRHQDLRDRQQLLDDLDDARDDLRRTVRQLVGSAGAVAVSAGAVAAEIWSFGEQWLAAWSTRALIAVTVSLGVSALEVLVSVLLSRRLASAKANLLTARRRHRDAALYDAEPLEHQGDVAELPPITRSGWTFAALAACALLCVLGLTSAMVTEVSSPPAAAGTAAPAPGLSPRPTNLAAWESTVPVDWPSGIAVSPDGRHAYIANSGPPDPPDADVAVVDLGTQTVTATLPVPPHPMALALTPDGRRLVVASTGSSTAPTGTLRVIDTATRHALSTIQLTAIPSDVTVSPDGRTAWCVISDPDDYDPGAAVAVDLATGTVIGSVPVGDNPNAITIAPDGRRAYVANFDDNTVSVIDTATRTVVATVPTGAGPSGLVVDQRRHTVWVADQNESDVHETLTAIDTNTLAATPVDLGPPAPGVGGAGSLAMTPDGRQLLVGRYSADNDTHPLLDVVDPDTRRTTKVVTMPWPYRIATTPDSHHALMSSGDLWVLDIP
ncbi:MAG TPA: YncE family protein [Pseudonocardiaceae bacterium]|nr:YncE family protein [Pseudonocardiaceae bacterium]